MNAPVFVLVRPQMGENIGAAARAMWNFGLEDMRISAPRDGWPNERAVTMASGATHLLDGATVTEDSAAAVSDLNYVFATTARPRDLTKRVFTPERAAQEMRARIATGERVGVLFGRERTGLENEDIIRANAIITVPVNPKFQSLNLAQCVLLMSYEWMRSADRTPPDLYDPGPSGMADHGDLSRFQGFLENELEAVRFFWPESKAPAMKAALRNLFSRAPLTDSDLRMLWGVVRALATRRRDRG